MTATWTSHSSRFVLRTGTNGHSSRVVIQPGRMGWGIRPGCPIPVGQPGQKPLKNRDQRGVSLLVKGWRVVSAEFVNVFVNPRLLLAAMEVCAVKDRANNGSNLASR